MRRPMVRMMRMPPENVPSEIAVAAAMITQSGMSSLLACSPPAISASTMTPIVFCASCSPWPSESIAAETVWLSRNPRLTVCGRARLKIHMIAIITRKAPVNPSNGLTTIGMATFSTTLSQSTATPDARPAPMSPPMRACDDEEGMPKYQVMRFQVMAPTSALATIVSAWLAESMVSNPVRMSLIVLATSTPSRAPTKFRTAAMASAMRGVRARVETDVAMALAASWKPFV